MSEKTEQPTPKRLRESKEKGQVAKSKEIVSLSMLLGILAYFGIFGDSLLNDIIGLFQMPTFYYDRDFKTIAFEFCIKIMTMMMSILAPMLAIVFVVGVVSNIAQTGWILSSEPIKPSLKKINPAEGLKKIFNIKNLVEFLKSITKILMLGFTAYYVIEKNLGTMLYIPVCGASCALKLSAAMVMDMILYCLGVFVFLAIGDFLFERYQHTKQLMMSMDEIKREYKESEGSPEIKGKRKQLHRELMDEVIEEKVSNSDLVVVNPTRIAVGIRYDSKVAPLPWVTVKGDFLMAKKIRRMAEKHDIPIVQRKYLARGMFAELEPDEFITAEFIEPVAEVLKWVRDMQSQYDNADGDRYN